MGCRDMEKCEAAAKEIRGNTLNPHVYALQLDLASVKSIREFAERIKQGKKTKTCHIKVASTVLCFDPLQQFLVYYLLLAMCLLQRSMWTY